MGLASLKSNEGDTTTLSGLKLYQEKQPRPSAHATHICLQDFVYRQPDGIPKFSTIAVSEMFLPMYEHGALDLSSRLDIIRMTV